MITTTFCPIGCCPAEHGPSSGSHITDLFGLCLGRQNKNWLFLMVPDHARVARAPAHPTPPRPTHQSPRPPSYSGQPPPGVLGTAHALKSSVAQPHDTHIPAVWASGWRGGASCHRPRVGMENKWLLNLLCSSLASGAVVFAGSPGLHEANLLQGYQRRAWRLQNQPTSPNFCTAALWNKA